MVSVMLKAANNVARGDDDNNLNISLVNCPRLGLHSNERHHRVHLKMVSVMLKAANNVAREDDDNNLNISLVNCPRLGLHSNERHH